MWFQSFEERLVAWNHLRRDLRDLDRADALLSTNDWWWRSPEITRDISWNHTAHWPDPWRLLASPAYSDLARALGIAYTVIMDDTVDARDIELVNDGRYNLVIVDRGKYILNYCPGELVNIATHPIDPKHSITGVELQQKTGTK